MEMTRLLRFLLVALVAIAGLSVPSAAPRAPLGPEPRPASKVPPLLEKVVKVPDRILVLRAQGERFEEAMTGLVRELAGEIRVEGMLIRPETDKADLESALRDIRPNAVVLMDNPAIQLFAQAQASWQGPAPFPPGIALMAVRVDQALAGTKRVTGIFYEVPGVTLMVNLRSLLASPVRKVGVVHRGAMGDFVRKSALWCAEENIELVPYEIPEAGVDVAKAVRTGVRHLWRKEKVDALWVLNDNFYLTPEIIGKGWLPALARFDKPVVVGVENFVSSGFKFGSFAVVPDNYGLGAQAAGLVLRLQEEGWRAEEEPEMRQPLAVKKLLNLRLMRKYSRIHEDRLKEMDWVTE